MGNESLASETSDFLRCHRKLREGDRVGGIYQFFISDISPVYYDIITVNMMDHTVVIGII